MMPGQRVALRERLRQAIAESITANYRLEQVIAEPTRSPRDQGRHGRVDHSQPPWNAPVAHLVTEMHARARDLEQTFRRRMNLPERTRGGAQGNTVFALEALSGLSESVDDPIVADAVGWLERWSARALVVLGERDRPSRLPRQPGTPEPRCPYCERLTLRFWSSRGEVRCINPACATEDGRRPAALMEYSSLAQDWVLAWNDGIVGVPA